MPPGSSDSEQARRPSPQRLRGTGRRIQAQTEQLVLHGLERGNEGNSEDG